MKESKNFVNKTIAAILPLFFSVSSLAQSPVSQVGANPRLSSPTDGALLPMLISLAGIIVLIYGLAWLAKRFNFTPNHHKHMKTVTSLSLGGRERIVIIEVQGEQHALGVTTNSVNHLFKLETPLPQGQLIHQDNKLLNKLMDMLNNKPITASENKKGATQIDNK